jgi:pyruvate formate lyase activating enzyme
LLREIKTLALEVKLDTNGLAPTVLAQALAEGLVDYVALDFKTALDRYGELHSGPVDGNALRQSIRMLLNAAADYEIRTTCVPGLVEAVDLRSMGEVMRGARRWVLQQFVPWHAMDQALQALTPHPPEQIRGFAEIAGEFAEQVSIRGL